MSLVADRITWGIQLLGYANIYSLTLEFSVLHSTSSGARATMFCNAILRTPSSFMSARLLHRSVGPQRVPVGRGTDCSRRAA